MTEDSHGYGDIGEAVRDGVTMQTILENAKTVEPRDGRPGAGSDKIAYVTPSDLNEYAQIADGSIRLVPLPEFFSDSGLTSLAPGSHVIVGPTGIGKTQLALQIAINAAKAYHPTLYIALELSREEVALRIAAQSLDQPQFWSSLYNTQKLALASEALAKYQQEQWPLAIWSTNARSESFIPDLVDRLALITDGDDATKATKNSPLRTPLVVLDYLQIAIPGGKDARGAITDTAYAIVNHARKHSAAVLMLSSTARDNSKILLNEPTKKTTLDFEPGTSDSNSTSPFIGFGYEASSIEYSASTVIAMGRPAPDDRGGGAVDSKTTYLAVAKHRHGLGKWATLVYKDGVFSPKAQKAGLSMGFEPHVGGSGS